MYYRLIIRKSTKSILEITVESNDYDFGKLYSVNGVTIIGDFYNNDDPRIGYTIMAYRDENHYKEFVTKMKTNEIYQKHTKYLSQFSESITNVPIDFSPMMKYNFDNEVMDHYLHEVRKTSYGFQINDSVNSNKFQEK